MKTKSRTEITIDTHRVLVIHTRRGLQDGLCERCGKQAGGISLQAATQAGVSLDAISSVVDEGRVHFSRCADGLSFICLDSLLQQFSKGDYFDEKNKA